MGIELEWSNSTFSKTILGNATVRRRDEHLVRSMQLHLGQTSPIASSPSRSSRRKSNTFAFRFPGLSVGGVIEGAKLEREFGKYFEHLIEVLLRYE